MVIRVRFDEVFALYDHMKSLRLDSERTAWNVSVAHLLTGNVEEGWPGHQARLKLPSATYPKIPRPMWLGEEKIEGKTILIAADEGLGDTIQFVRYDVRRLGATGGRTFADRRFLRSLGSRPTFPTIHLARFTMTNATTSR